MTIYVFRVWLYPNPPLGFDPDDEVWRDIEVDSSQTLDDFHEAIFDAFERWETHGYEFLTHDEDGIATRSYVHPQFYDGEPSWPPMDADDIERFIDQAVPDDVSEDAKERFRDLYLDALVDGDGRVRRAAAKAIKELALTAEMIGADAELQTMLDELDALAEEGDESTQKHIDQAYENVAFHTEKPGSLLPDGIRDALELDESSGDR